MNVEAKGNSIGSQASQAKPSQPSQTVLNSGFSLVVCCAVQVHVAFEMESEMRESSDFIRSELAPAMRRLFHIMMAGNDPTSDQLSMLRLFNMLYQTSISEDHAWLLASSDSNLLEDFLAARELLLHDAARLIDACVAHSPISANTAETLLIPCQLICLYTLPEGIPESSMLTHPQQRRSISRLTRVALQNVHSGEWSMSQEQMPEVLQTILVGGLQVLMRLGQLPAPEMIAAMWELQPSFYIEELFCLMNSLLSELSSDDFMTMLIAAVYSCMMIYRAGLGAVWGLFSPSMILICKRLLAISMSPSIKATSPLTPATDRLLTMLAFTACVEIVPHPGIFMPQSRTHFVEMSDHTYFRALFLGTARDSSRIRSTMMLLRQGIHAWGNTTLRHDQQASLISIFVFLSKQAMRVQLQQRVQRAAERERQQLALLGRRPRWLEPTQAPDLINPINAPFLELIEVAFSKVSEVLASNDVLPGLKQDLIGMRSTPGHLIATETIIRGMFSSKNVARAELHEKRIAAYIILDILSTPTTVTSATLSTCVSMAASARKLTLEYDPVISHRLHSEKKMRRVSVQVLLAVCDTELGPDLLKLRAIVANILTDSCAGLIPSELTDEIGIITNLMGEMGGVQKVVLSLLTTLPRVPNRATQSTTWSTFAPTMLPGCNNEQCLNMDGCSEYVIPDLKFSGVCGVARYCCVACQKKGWVQAHRHHCNS